MICKYSQFPRTVDDTKRFYINYVICKSFSEVIIILSVVSFILTMWYVNGEYKLEITSNDASFILTMWYVNNGQLTHDSSSQISFILTMWYVNSWGGYWCWDDDKSFILTMWYVNVSVLLSHSIKRIVLY